MVYKRIDLSVNFLFKYKLIIFMNWYITITVQDRNS